MFLRSLVAAGLLLATVVPVVAADSEHGRGHARGHHDEQVSGLASTLSTLLASGLATAGDF
jgi:hypothetical protein